MEEYNPATRGWTSRSPMPTARFGFGSVELDGYIFVIGGRSSNGVLSTVERYDPSSDSWTTLAVMPTARWNLMAVAVDGSLVAIGGVVGTGDSRRKPTLV